MKEMVDWSSTLVKPGEQYSRYLILSTHKKAGTYRYFALCACECGSEPRYVSIDGLRRGTQKSCGCLQREGATTHGMWGHPIFKIWSAMMRRCYNQKDKRYNRYGERGIDVCERWHNVGNFVDDMSNSYIPGLQIDRINNDLGYSPENCRWTDKYTQAQNKSNIKKYTHDGKTMCLTEWSRHLKIPFTCLRSRIDMGWSVEKTLTTPIKK